MIQHIPVGRNNHDSQKKTHTHTAETILPFKSNWPGPLLRYVYCSSKKETPSYDRGKAKYRRGVAFASPSYRGRRHRVVDPAPLSPHSPVSPGNSSSTALRLTHADREGPLPPALLHYETVHTSTMARILRHKHGERCCYLATNLTPRAQGSTAGDAPPPARPVNYDINKAVRATKKVEKNKTQKTQKNKTDNNTCRPRQQRHRLLPTLPDAQPLPPPPPPTYPPQGLLTESNSCSK